EHKRSRTIDSTKIRLSVFAMLLVGCFVALYSRLWYLQVLASDEFKREAKNNRVRVVQSEPPRGRILDRQGNILVDNKRSLTVALERDLLESNPRKWTVVLARLSMLLDVKLQHLHDELDNVTISPYKPLPVAYDVPEEKIAYIEEHPEKFPGVVYDTLWSRKVVRGHLAPHVLGYTNEISEDELNSKEWKGYDLGDIIGKAGVERTFDEVLRGIPRRERVVVDATNDPISKLKVVQEESPGADVMLTIAPRIQGVTQAALASGVLGARGEREAPSGAAVVMDPNTGQVLAIASFPTYDARITANGYTTKEYMKLGGETPKDPSDDTLINRPIMAPLPPGSTFKAITAAAALSLDVVGAYDYVSCPATSVLPPNDGGYPFPNNSGDRGSLSIIEALEVSCNTFFYQLGWRMEERYGPGFDGDGTLEFQRFARAIGMGHETGIDLPYESPGVMPDPITCRARKTCPDGWLPGYTINMAVGQGDLLTSPLQMAVAFGALANGGNVMEPQIAKAVSRTGVDGEEEIVEEFPPTIKTTINLEPEEFAVIREGLEQVTQGGLGTANDAFVGFPVSVAGKTGTAQVGEAILDVSHSWFVSYAPSTDPQYVVAVYVERGGIGGQVAAPIAREIYEGIFLEGDRDASVNIGSGGYD
ncbi:MAG: penicillin-binding protein 2, partial [Actinomycetota bacterium]|nr:penicillin-binding protein 2 [Actinomycetota bacterium]